MGGGSGSGGGDGGAREVVVVDENGGLKVRELSVVSGGVVGEWSHVVDASGGEYAARVGRSGDLGSIVLAKRGRKMSVDDVDGDEGVVVAVRAAGVNFHDVMSGLGLLSDAAVAGGEGGHALGGEFAGVVV